MIRFVDFAYDYPDAMVPSLGPTSLTVPKGALVLVVGPSGVGKSTLLRAVNGLVPSFTGGTVTGHVSVAGLNPVLVGPGAMSRHVGFVSGDPETTFVTDVVEDEVAFALEHQGIGRERMRRRVLDALRAVGLRGLRHRLLATLSGGEKQRVALAGALALRPQVLVLDEPTSQLDDTSAEAVLNSTVTLARSGELTIVMSEHRIDRVVPHADLVVHIGGVGEKPEIGTPDVMAHALRRVQSPSAPPIRPGPVVLRLTALGFAYDSTPVLDGAALHVHAGEVVALTGPSGCGKTTLLRLCIGLIEPDAGEVYVAGESIAGNEVAYTCRSAGYLPQDPGALLFADSVEEELEITLSNHGLQPDAARNPLRLLERLGIGPLAKRYPRDLSTGERQRVALGAVAVTNPPLLLLDEPTRGLDDAAIADLANLLHDQARAGTGVLVATHDRRLVGAAHRVLELRHGRVAACRHVTPSPD